MEEREDLGVALRARSFERLHVVFERRRGLTDLLLAERDVVAHAGRPFHRRDALELPERVGPAERLLVLRRGGEEIARGFDLRRRRFRRRRSVGARGGGVREEHAGDEGEDSVKPAVRFACAVFGDTWRASGARSRRPARRGASPAPSEALFRSRPELGAGCPRASTWTPCSTLATAFALAGRCAGSLARSWRMRSSTGRGRPTARLGRGGGWATIASTRLRAKPSSPAAVPATWSRSSAAANGRSPVTSSKASTPNEYRSVARLTSAPRSCSGAAYGERPFERPVVRLPEDARDP